MSLSNNSAWTFPTGAPSNSSYNQYANPLNTTNTTGFGTLPLYINDGIRLNWTAAGASSSFPTPQNITYTCVYNTPGSQFQSTPHSYSSSFYTYTPPYTYTLRFLSSSSSLSSTPNATESCFFSLETFQSSTSNPKSIAFRVIYATRSQPLLFSSDAQSGIPWTPDPTPTYGPYGYASPSNEHKLAKILGAVLGVLGIIAVVFVLWWVRQRRKTARLQKAKERAGEGEEVNWMEMGDVGVGVGEGMRQHAVERREEEIGEAPPPSYSEAMKRPGEGKGGTGGGVSLL